MEPNPYSLSAAIPEDLRVGRRATVVFGYALEHDESLTIVSSPYLEDGEFKLEIVLDRRARLCHGDVPSLEEILAGVTDKCCRQTVTLIMMGVLPRPTGNPWSEHCYTVIIARPEIS